MQRGAISLTALVFLIASAYLYWTKAHSFVMSNDEGIFLDGSRRILEGQVPYRDFFILMGPGSFWLQAAVLKLFGLTLAASRTVVILDLSGIAGCIFWLVARRTNAALGAFVAAVYIILEAADPIASLPNHRWDSAALAILAVTILASETCVPGLICAGICAAFAAWVTPSVGIVGVTLLAFLFLTQRRRVWPFLIGATVVSLAVVIALWSQGALTPMLRQIVWTGSNYGRVNFMTYGTIVGGYGNIFRGSQGSELVIRAFVTLGLVLPAVLPPIALLLWCFHRRYLDSTGVIAAGAVALVLSSYPRMDIPHLAYAAPLFYVLLAITMAVRCSNPIRMFAFLYSSLLATSFGIFTVAAHMGEVQFESRVGTLRASMEDAELIRTLEQQIPVGSELFVYPYLPVLNFLTLTKNPTRYSYLQPGLMTDGDEEIALAEIRANPEASVIYYDFPEKQLLRIWPRTDPKRLRLPCMEEFLATHYRKRRGIPYHGWELEILERLPDATISP